jgi:hypothetical protein
MRKRCSLHGSAPEVISKSILSIMSRLTEIQKPIKELAPEEREELRDWLDGYDSAVTCTKCAKVVSYLWSSRAAQG